MVSNGIFSQFSFFLLIAVSGWFLMESNGYVMNVTSELGNSVLLNVPNQNSSTDHDVKWLRGNYFIARYKSGPTVYGTFRRRVNIFPNGSLRVNSTSKSDEGKYKVNIYNRNGVVQLSQQFILYLFEKLSTPVMNINCVTEQNVLVSCEVHGAIPVSFYLNEQRLTEHNAVFSDDGRKATLKNFTSFSNNKTFYCKVENPISKSQSAPRQIICAGSMAIYLYIIFIALGVIALIIFVRLLCCCISKTNNCNMKKLRICEDYH